MRPAVGCQQPAAAIASGGLHPVASIRRSTRGGQELAASGRRPGFSLALVVAGSGRQSRLWLAGRHGLVVTGGARLAARPAPKGVFCQHGAAPRSTGLGRSLGSCPITARSSRRARARGARSAPRGSGAPWSSTSTPSSPPQTRRAGTPSAGASRAPTTRAGAGRRFTRSRWTTRRPTSVSRRAEPGDGAARRQPAKRTRRARIRSPGAQEPRSPGAEKTRRREAEDDDEDDDGDDLGL